MVVRNWISRYHLAAEAVRRSRPLPTTQALLDECAEMLRRHKQYMTEHLEDMPEVRDWTWSDVASVSPVTAPVGDKIATGAA
jgi:xylulose-5-phosphate/fructose-6-phosphate phosphoketolase